MGVGRLCVCVRGHSRRKQRPRTLFLHKSDVPYSGVQQLLSSLFFLFRSLSFSHFTLLLFLLSFDFSFIHARALVVNFDAVMP